VLLGWPCIGASVTIEMIGPGTTVLKCWSCPGGRCRWAAIRSALAMPTVSSRAAAAAGTRSPAGDPVRPVTFAVAGGAAAVGLVALLLGVLVGGALVGLVLGVVVACAVGGGAWAGVVRPRLATAEDHALELLPRVRPVGDQPGADQSLGDRHDARFTNLVEGLAPAAGLGRPRCFVVEDTAPNALAAGRDQRHGCVVVTSGLLDALSRMELEGVVAHCLVRIRDGAVAAPTVALAFGRRPQAPAPLGSNVAADLAAVSLTRYPPGLATALRRIAPAAGAVPVGASPLLDSLWLVPPGSADELEARVEALEEL